MGCRGAIHCAHLGSRGIPLGAMNCAPTPCAYLKGIDPCGQPWEVGLKLVRMGDRKGSPWPLPWPLIFPGLVCPFRNGYLYQPGNFCVPVIVFSMNRSFGNGTQSLV